MEKQSFKCIGGINLPLCFLLLNFLCNEGLPIGLGQRLVIAWTANTYVPPGIQFPPLSLNLAGIAPRPSALATISTLVLSPPLDADDAPCCNARTKL